MAISRLILVAGTLATCVGCNSEKPPEQAIEQAAEIAQPTQAPEATVRSVEPPANVLQPTLYSSRRYTLPVDPERYGYVLEETNGSVYIGMDIFKSPEASLMISWSDANEPLERRAFRMMQNISQASQGPNMHIGLYEIEETTFAGREARIADFHREVMGPNRYRGLDNKVVFFTDGADYTIRLEYLSPSRISERAADASLNTVKEECEAFWEMLETGFQARPVSAEGHK